MIIKKIILFFLCFLCCEMVHAECTDEKIAELKEQSNNIEVKYEYKDNLYNEDFDMSVVNIFDIYIYGLTDDLYINVSDDDLFYDSNNLVDGVLKIENINGGSSFKFDVYSNECAKKLKTINFNVPYYNSFYENELCKTRQDASVCSKFLNYELSYEKFKNEIEKYDKDKNPSNDGNNDTLNILNIILNNLIYIALGVLIIIIVVVFIVIYKKRRELS